MSALVPLALLVATVPGGPLLTPDDTYSLYFDALPVTTDWAFTTTTELVGDPVGTDDPVTHWRVQVTEAEPGGGSWVIDHTAITTAMRLIANHPARLGLSRRFSARVRAVLDAHTAEDATDELVQLDCYDFDAIVQVATRGRVD